MELDWLSYGRGLATGLTLPFLVHLYREWRVVR
jgi:hypothetical protein